MIVREAEAETGYAATAAAAAIVVVMVVAVVAAAAAAGTCHQYQYCLFSDGTGSIRHVSRRHVRRRQG